MEAASWLTRTRGAARAALSARASWQGIKPRPQVGQKGKAAMARKASKFKNLALAKDEYGCNMEVSMIDTKSPVQFRLYEPVETLVGDDVFYTHIIDLDVSFFKEAQIWNRAYTLHLLEDMGDTSQQLFQDHADWVVNVTTYETVFDKTGAPFMRLTFTDNPPAHLVIA